MTQTELVLAAIGVIWLAAGIWALLSWDRSHAHSLRARRNHREAGENGTYQVITETSITIDRIGMFQAAVLLALLVNTFIPEDLRIFVARPLLVALAVSVALMGDRKYSGESLSRELLRRAQREPMPDGTVIPEGTVIPPGTVIQPGTVIPPADDAKGATDA